MDKNRACTLIMGLMVQRSIALVDFFQINLHLHFRPEDDPQKVRSEVLQSLDSRNIESRQPHFPSEGRSGEAA